MNLQEYIKETNKTAFYPGEIDDFRLAYLALKMCGEAKELFEACDRTRAIKEAGDNLWYWAQFINVLGLDAQGNPWTDRTDYLIRPSQFMINACGLAELVGKIYRDKQGKPDQDDIIYFTIIMNDNLEKLANYMQLNYSVDMETIARTNLEKLKDRKKRGKLGGSGDDR